MLKCWVLSPYRGDPGIFSPDSVCGIFFAELSDHLPRSHEAHEVSFWTTGRAEREWSPSLPFSRIPESSQSIPSWRHLRRIFCLKRSESVETVVKLPAAHNLPACLFISLSPLCTLALSTFISQHFVIWPSSISSFFMQLYAGGDESKVLTSTCTHVCVWERVWSNIPVQMRN